MVTIKRNIQRGIMNRKLNIKLPLFLAAVLLLSACTNVSSVKTLSCDEKRNNCVGVTYYLPKRHAVLSIKRAKEIVTKKNNEWSFTGRCLDTIRVDLQAAVPDLKHQYTAQLKHLIISHDEIAVGVNSRGLLDSRDNLNGSPGGQRQPVLNQVVELDNEECASNDFATVFDPTEETQTSLPAPYLDYRVSVFEAVDANDQQAPTRQRVSGLIYRRSKPYVFTFEQCGAEGCVTRQAAQAMLPNKGSVAVVPYRNTAFVKTKYLAQFKDGELVTWDATRPAEVIEIIKVPLDLLHTLVSVPMRIIGATR